MNRGRKIIGLYGKQEYVMKKVTQILEELFKYTEITLSQSFEEVVHITFGIKLRQLYGPEIPVKKFLYSPRELLERIGNRLYSDEIWLRILSAKIDGACRNVVVSDVKTEGEIKLIKSLGGEVFHVYKIDENYEYDLEAERLREEFDGHIVDAGCDDDLIYMVFRLIARHEFCNLHL